MYAEDRGSTQGNGTAWETATVPFYYRRQRVSSGEEVFTEKILRSSVVRKQLSRYRDAELLLVVVDQDSKPVEVDPGTLGLSLLTISPTGDSTAKFVASPSEFKNPNPGVYSYILTGSYTATPKAFKAVWEWEVEGRGYTFEEHYEVLENMPLYSTLSPGEKDVVERVMWMFGDLFDNTSGGGPSFIEEFQTHFGYERVAQLMTVSLDRINATKQPFTNFSVGRSRGKRFPSKWYSLLTISTYIEVLKHFVRTYVEQPSLGQMGVAYADRRDYMQRWQQVLNDELRGYEDMLRMFKRDQMGLGSGAFIVAGGPFGAASSYGPSLAARGGRFYPTSTVVVRR